MNSNCKSLNDRFLGCIGHEGSGCLGFRAVTSLPGRKAGSLGLRLIDSLKIVSSILFSVLLRGG